MLKRKRCDPSPPSEMDNEKSLKKRKEKNQEEDAKQKVMKIYRKKYAPEKNLL